MGSDENMDAGYGIIARKRVWAITGGRLPTVQDYHAALVQCLEDKATEIARLQAENELLAAVNQSSHSALLVIDGGFKNALAEIERLRLTDAEREAVRFCAEFCRMGDRADLAATLRGLLDRISGS